MGRFALALVIGQSLVFFSQAVYPRGVRSAVSILLRLLGRKQRVAGHSRTLLPRSGAQYDIRQLFIYLRYLRIVCSKSQGDGTDY